MPFELAQLNIATMKGPLDSPVMADFVANLGRINALAEQSPGFVWRLKDENGDATGFRPFGDNIVINLSVWTDVASLHRFTFGPAHVEMLKRKRDWFEHMADAAVVLWWVPQGQRPTVADAAQRLDELRRNGASALAFTFRKPFAPPDSPAALERIGHGHDCPAWNA